MKAAIYIRTPMGFRLQYFYEGMLLDLEERVHTGNVGTLIVYPSSNELTALTMRSIHEFI